MSLDKTGIEHIQKTGNPVVDVETNVPVKVIAEGYKIENMEKYFDHPSRFRGCYSTELIKEFQSYIAQQGQVVCFINDATMEAKAFFDLGNENNPGHGEHRATLRLEKLSPYAAMCEINGKHQSQRELAEWLEDWRDYAVGLDIEEVAINIKKAIAAIRNITVSLKSEAGSEEKNLGHRRTGLEELDIKSGEENLPAYIQFTCEPYDGLSVRAFKMRLGVVTNRHDKPEVVLRVVQFEKIKEEMTIEFKDILLLELDKETTFIGAFNNGR